MLAEAWTHKGGMLDLLWSDLRNPWNVIRDWVWIFQPRNWLTAEENSHLVRGVPGKLELPDTFRFSSPALNVSYMYHNHIIATKNLKHSFTHCESSMQAHLQCLENTPLRYLSTACRTCLVFFLILHLSIWFYHLSIKVLITPLSTIYHQHH